MDKRQRGNVSSSRRSKKSKNRHGKNAKHSKQGTKGKKSNKKRGKSDDDSSSSRSKKVKKEKKRTKEKDEVTTTTKEKLREAAKLQALAEKVERARVVKVKCEASKVMSKVAPWLTQVEQLITDPNAAKVPSIMIKKVKESVAQLNMYQNEAKEKLQLKDPLDLTFSIDDVGPVVKEAAGTIKLMNSMLIAVGNKHEHQPRHLRRQLHHLRQQQHLRRQLQPPRRPRASRKSPSSSAEPVAGD